MGTEDPQSVSFVGWNLVFIGIVALGIFGYLLMLVRKRWKGHFLHRKVNETKTK